MRKINEIFSLDIRSLALFRVALAVTLLMDLAIRSHSLDAFYTDAGLLPRAVWASRNPRWFYSFHLLSGTAGFEKCLFAIAALAALGLLVGYRTKAMTFLSWILLVSLHTRQPQMLTQDDMYFRLSLFWSLFLPLGSCFSIDAARRRSPSANVSVTGWGAAGLILQTVIIYWATAARKLSGADWLKTGHAVFYALHMGPFATPLGHSLLAFPDFIRAATYVVLFIEIIAPAILLSPVSSEPLRMTAIALLAFLQLCFALFLRIAPFPRVSLMELLPFIPASVWRRTSAKESPARNKNPLWVEGIAAVSLFLIVGHVLGPFLTRDRKLPRWPIVVEAPFLMARLDQQWGMFAPNVYRPLGWFVIPGRLKSGKVVDLYRDGAPLSWAAPPDPSAAFRDERWRKYLCALLESPRQQRERLEDYSRYLCHQWNTAHEGSDSLESLTISQVAAVPRVDGGVEVPQRIPLWQSTCQPEIQGRVE